MQFISAIYLIVRTANNIVPYIKDRRKAGTRNGRVGVTPAKHGNPTETIAEGTMATSKIDNHYPKGDLALRQEGNSFFWKMNTTNRRVTRCAGQSVQC